MPSTNRTSKDTILEDIKEKWNGPGSVVDVNLVKNVLFPINYEAEYIPGLL